MNIKSFYPTGLFQQPFQNILKANIAYNLFDEGLAKFLCIASNPIKVLHGSALIMASFLVVNPSLFYFKEVLHIINLNLPLHLANTIIKTTKIIIIALSIIGVS